MTMLAAFRDVGDRAEMAGVPLPYGLPPKHRRLVWTDDINSFWAPTWRRLQGAVAFDVLGELVERGATPTSFAAPVEDRLSGGLVFADSFRTRTTWSAAAADMLARSGQGVFVIEGKATTPARALAEVARVVEGALDYEEFVRELPVSSRGESRAFRAFTELRTWLRMSAAEAAELVGVGRTTPNAWQRMGHEPRPANARKLLQIHSIVGALVRQLGQEETLRWLEAGSPSPSELLLDGNIAAVASAVEALVIGPQPLRGPKPGALIQETGAGVATPESSLKRRSVRKRREVS